MVFHKFRRVETLDALYSAYSKRFVTERSDPVKRLFQDEYNDCAETATVCVSNADCAAACAFAGQKSFYCDSKSRLCLEATTTTTTEARRKFRNGCFPHKGVVPALRGDAQITSASKQCVSLFPSLFDDDGNKAAGVCDGEGSKFNVNLRAHFPRIEDCVCSPNRKLITFSGRTFGYVRSPSDIPRCVLHPRLYI